MKLVFRHRVRKNTIKQPNPLHVLVVLAVRESQVKTPNEVWLDNFCQRPGQMDLDH